MTCAALPKENHFMCSSPECEHQFSVLVPGPGQTLHPWPLCEVCGAKTIWVTDNDFKLLEGISGLATAVLKRDLESVLEVGRQARELVRDRAEDY